MFTKPKAIVEVYNDSTFIHKLNEKTFYYNNALQCSGKKLYVFVHDREIYIEQITLPKLNKNDTIRLLYNKFKCYVNDIDCVIFNYAILKKSKNTQDLLIYCISWKRLSLLKELSENHNTIGAVYAIQFCYLSYFSKYINYDNYIFCFKHKTFFYLTACRNKLLLSNKVINIDKDLDIMSEIILFRDEINKIDCKIEGIFLVNADIPINFNNMIGFDIVKFNSIDAESIIEFSINKGGIL